MAAISCGLLLADAKYWKYAAISGGVLLVIGAVFLKTVPLISEAGMASVSSRALLYADAV